MSDLNRRTILAGAAAVTAISAIEPIALNNSAHAAAPAAGKQAAGFYRYKIGDYEITALNDGI